MHLLSSSLAGVILQPATWPFTGNNSLEEFPLLEVLVFALQGLHKEGVVLLQQFVDLLKESLVLLLHGSEQLVLHLKEGVEDRRGGRTGGRRGQEGREDRRGGWGGQEGRTGGEGGEDRRGGRTGGEGGQEGREDRRGRWGGQEGKVGRTGGEGGQEGKVGRTGGEGGEDRRGGQEVEGEVTYVHIHLCTAIH